MTETITYKVVDSAVSIKLDTEAKTMTIVFSDKTQKSYKLEQAEEMTGPGVVEEKREVTAVTK